jgi:hypothetical protein
MFSLAVFVFSWAASPAIAEEARSSESRLAANVWGGVGLAEAEHTPLISLKGGISVGYKLSSKLSLVGLGEYHLFGDDKYTFHSIFAGGGLRYQPVQPVELMLGAGYVLTRQEKNPQRWINGVGLRVLAFFPLLAGFGPFAELEYSPHWGQPRTFQVAAWTLGASYSF